MAILPSAFDLDTYTCSPLPDTLWRVTHPGTQSRQDSGTGDMVASASTYTLSTRESLKQAAEDHFDWSCRRRSCFLSVLSGEEHALNWAKRCERAQGTVYIHEIDTTELPRDDVHVFDAVSLTRKLGIAHQPSPDEFLFLYRIPAESITRTRSVSEVEYGDDEVKPEIPHISITGPDSFDKVTVRVCPLLETTPRRGSQAGTRDRCWRGTLSFSNDKGRTKVIRVDNVYVLKKTPREGGGEGDGSYGTRFVNISIPGYVRERIAAAILAIYPDCKVDEERFEPNMDRWFKPISNVEKILTLATPNPRPGGEPIVKHCNVMDALSTVGHAVEIRADLKVAVEAKATPLDNNLGPQGGIHEAGTGAKTVKVTAQYGLVTNPDTGNVDMPRFAQGRFGRVSASALAPIEANFASESLLKRLSELGLDVSD